MSLPLHHFNLIPIRCHSTRTIRNAMYCLLNRIQYFWWSTATHKTRKCPHLL